MLPLTCVSINSMPVPPLLAEKVIRLTGNKSHLTFKALPADDPRQRQPDMSLAREKLKWEPKVDLDDGLKETIAYFRRTLGLS